MFKPGEFSALKEHVLKDKFLITISIVISNVYENT